MATTYVGSPTDTHLPIEPLEHHVTVRIAATDPQDGHHYSEVLWCSSHHLTVAWWLGSPRITEVIEPCPCGGEVTITAQVSRWMP